MEIEVKGHSGCQIDIVREGNDLFIFKSSSDKNYLQRLVKQAEKQVEAAKEEYQHIRVPKIFCVEQDDCHVSVKMEYVYSRNFIEYFESAGFEQIDYFIKALILFIEKELKASPVQNISTAITMDKFLDVEKKVKSNTILGNDEDVQKLMVRAKKRFDLLSRVESIAIPVGLCHGDLTFSNILFNGNNYYLIDFLDSFIESPLMDIVKIRQDSAHLWSQLMYVKPFDKLRLKIICQKIDKEIDKYFAKYDWYRQYYEIYQLLNLLRILQYAKNEKIISFLKVEIKRTLDTVSETSLEQSQSTLKASNSLSLIVPAAADDDSRTDTMPHVFNLDQNGIMLCIRAIQGLDLKAFDNIYFTILRKHVELYCLDELFKLQFKRLGMNNAHVVVLEKPTQSQAETVYETIKKESIKGGIFIKDSDCYFECEVIKGNGIALYALDEISKVDPQHKSYVAVDDNYYITNVIEKKIISRYFNAGGYSFDDSFEFLYYYDKLKGWNGLYLSHIIYSMLLDRKLFRPISTLNYADFNL